MLLAHRKYFNYSILASAYEKYASLRFASKILRCIQMQCLLSNMDLKSAFWFRFVISKNLDHIVKRKLQHWPLVFINIVTGQTLSRSYGRCIAEFLDEESLVRLGLLDPSTCVGLRYG